MNDDLRYSEEKPQDEEDLEPSFEELCKENHPSKFRFATILMWALFLAFVGTSVFNIFRDSVHAKAVLADHTEVQADIVEIVQVLEDGEYTDYSLDLEYLVAGQVSALTLEIKEDVYVEKYVEADAIPLVYWNVDPSVVNLRAYFERRAYPHSYWGGVSFGYLVVFILAFLFRHILLRLICRRTPA